MRKTFFILSFLIICYSSIISQNIVQDLEYHPNFDKNLFPFFHGVASGDATSECVIIWTRVTPETKMRSINVKWYFATDSLMKDLIQSGEIQTRTTEDYTVKVDVCNLIPNTVYYYQFEAYQKYSVIGKTKTLAHETKNLIFNFAVVSCANYNAGFFNAYDHLSKQKNIDAVIGLGDYFYEYETNKYGKHNNRALMPDKELTDLEDYRTRYSHYKLDPTLQKTHQYFCWYLVWDDHESANNSWKNGAQNHQLNEGLWCDRKNSSKKAFFEWLPIRVKQDSSIYRSFDFGKTVKIIFLDTRLEGRDFQAIEVSDTNKSMLGKKQLDWLFQEVLTAQKDSFEWIIIAQQVMFAPMKLLGIIPNQDQWDGYNFERQKILKFLYKNNIKNVGIISGDIHSSWANQVYFNKKNKKEFIPEFITTSITSYSTSKFVGFFANIFIRATKYYVKYLNLTKKGYMTLKIDNNNLTAQWIYMSTIKRQKYKIRETKKYIYKKSKNLKIKKMI